MIVSGRVQGVFFAARRPTRRARSGSSVTHAIAHDGTVEIVAEGDRNR